jgi:hypothetical protein
MAEGQYWCTMSKNVEGVVLVQHPVLTDTGPILRQSWLCIPPIITTIVIMRLFRLIHTLQGHKEIYISGLGD